MKEKVEWGLVPYAQAQILARCLRGDLDEYPPAMSKEGGFGADIRGINRSDNRGSGSSAGHQLRNYPDGTKFHYKITD